MRSLIKTLHFIILFFWTSSSFGQVPQAFSFQGVALNAQGQPIISSSISIEVKILQGSATGEVKYIETHNVTTNANGLYSLSIGLGVPVQGSFEIVDWSQIPMFISVGIDINNGNNFILAGVTQLLSVPYALQAGIKPKIYLKAGPIAEPINLINGLANSNKSSIKYFYQWIDGNPENIFVEYKGLPDNIHLSSFREDNYLLPKIVTNYSKIDTIFDGILKRETYLQISDVGLNITTGKYPLTLVFKTKNYILDSLHFELQIDDTSYEDCLPNLPSTKVLQSNDCPEINTYIEPSLYLEKYNNTKVKITNIFNKTLFDFIDFNQIDCKNILVDQNGGKFIGDYLLTIYYAKLEGNSMTYSLEYRNMIDESAKSCTVKYE